MPAAAFLAAALLAAAPAVSFEGPLQVRNQFPLFISLDAPYLESAAVQDSATVSLSYSSVYVTQSSADWTVNMDFEMTELMVRLKKELNERTEVGVDIPFYRVTEGFLDEPLAKFHSALGTGDYGRSARPYNEFLYEVIHQGKPVIKPVVHQSGVGDVRLTAKRVLHDGGPLVSVQANVEAPTGDAKQGYGNGS